MILFFVEAWGLSIIPFPTTNYGLNIIITSFFIFVTTIFGLGIIFKVFSPIISETS